MKKVNQILLIVDNKTTVHINQWEINKLNITHQIQVAENGSIALEYLQQESLNGKRGPDLIFLDHQMPIMNGFEFLQEYSKLEVKGTKAILIMLTTSMHQQINQVESDDIKFTSQFSYPNKGLTEGEDSNI